MKNNEKMKYFSPEVTMVGISVADVISASVASDGVIELNQYNFGGFEE